MRNVRALRSQVCLRISGLVLLYGFGLASASARASGFFEDWDFQAELGVEIPTKLDSLAVLTRCDFGPYLSAFFRYEKAFDENSKVGVRSPRWNAYLPLRLELSPSVTAYTGAGFTRWGGKGAFSALVGSEFIPVGRIIGRTEMAMDFTSGNARSVFSLEGLLRMPSQSGRRRDYLGLRFEVAREQTGYRDSRFLIATGSQF